MNRLEKKLASLKKQKRKALSVFLTAGFPSLAATPVLAQNLEEAGADFFEIGFPFSDPIADGPVIQKASDAALKNGLTWEKMLGMVRAIREKSQAPLVLMAYANSLYCRGWEASARDLAAAGFDGVILPDLIPEETGDVRRIFRQKGLSLVYLLAPTSSPERTKKILSLSSGFVYCVSVTGVTGARKSLPLEEINRFLKGARRHTRLPLMLGFGISEPAQVRLLGQWADGFVIGSALIKILQQKGSAKNNLHHARAFVKSFADSLSKSRGTRG